MNIPSSPMSKRTPMSASTAPPKFTKIGGGGAPPVSPPDKGKTTMVLRGRRKAAAQRKLLESTGSDGSSGSDGPIDVDRRILELIGASPFETRSANDTDETVGLAIDYKVAAGMERNAALKQGNYDAGEERNVQNAFTGRFLVRRFIAGGSYGSVHLCTDEVSNRDVAVKTFKLGVDQSKDAVVRGTALAEIMTLNYLRGVRNVVQYVTSNVSHVDSVLTLGSPDDDDYEEKSKRLVSEIRMAMEYVRGSSLAQYLNTVREKAPGKRLDSKTAGSLVRQLLAGIRDVHAMGIAHRDLTPNNVLVREDGVIKITDFGSAGTMSTEGSRVGFTDAMATVAYASPETILHVRLHPSEMWTIDVWSVACIVHEVYTSAWLFTPQPTAVSQFVRIFTRLGMDVDDADWYERREWLTQGFYYTQTEVEACRAAFGEIKDTVYARGSDATVFGESLVRDYPKVVEGMREMLCVIPTERMTPQNLLTRGYFNT